MKQCMFVQTDRLSCSACGLTDGKQQWCSSFEFQIFPAVAEGLDPTKWTGEVLRVFRSIAKDITSVAQVRAQIRVLALACIFETAFLAFCVQAAYESNWHCGHPERSKPSVCSIIQTRSCNFSQTQACRCHQDAHCIRLQAAYALSGRTCCARASAYSITTRAHPEQGHQHAASQPGSNTFL